MVAEQRDGAARRKVLHGVDDEARIGAIADVVAEKHVTIDRMSLRMRETRFERFAVAVDVRKQGDQHDVVRRRDAVEKDRPMPPARATG